MQHIFQYLFYALWISYLIYWWTTSRNVKVRTQGQAGDHHAQGQGHADKESHYALLPIKPAPERQQEPRVINHAYGNAHEYAGDHWPAIGDHGPDQKRGRNHVIHLPGHLAGVEREQVKRCRRHSGMDIVEMPIADQYHADDHCQVAEDGRAAGRRHLDFLAAEGLGLRAVDRYHGLAGKTANL